MTHRLIPVAVFVSALLLIIIAAPLECPGNSGSTHPGPQSKAIDPSLAKPATAVMFGHREKALFLIDIRPPAEYEKYHIPGALNIPLHAIKTKPFLKSKPIVLVNSGFDLVSPARTCEKLNQNGYRATIMAGGLCAWKVKGGALTGDPFARRDMNLISARQFHREQAADVQWVGHLTDATDPQRTSRIPGAVTLPLSDTDLMMSRIKTWMKTKNSHPFANIVLMTTTGKDNHRIQRLLFQAGLHHQVYFIMGGLEAYEEYLEFGKLARKPKEERQMSTGDCQSCARK